VINPANAGAASHHARSRTAVPTVIHAFGDHAWFGHPNAAVDVAAMPLWQVLDEMHRIGGPPYFKSVAPSLCLTEDRAAELDSIEDVTFVGYPSGIFDTKNLLPIARRGSTATAVSVDYRGVPAFLIDASVFPGSSGSPVFVVNRGFTVSRGGSITVGGGGVLCLGILAAMHARPLEGRLVELPTRLGVTFSEPIDLGIVFRASTFDECVNPSLRRWDCCVFPTARLHGRDRNQRVRPPQTVKSLKRSPQIKGSSASMCPTAAGSESNQRTRFGKPLLYPLSYGGGPVQRSAGSPATGRGYAHGALFS
jgi:hypothetical protein